MSQTDTQINSRSESVGVKNDAHKPYVDLIDSYALTELAKVLTFGAKKYSAHNWRGGIQYSCIIASCFRHLMSINSGENVDAESGLPHAAHLMCNAMFLTWMMRYRDDMDNRFVSEENVEI